MILPLLLALAAAPPPAAASTGTIDRAAWITADDYPAEALKYRMQGRVEFTLNADREGAIAGCAVTRSSGYAVLDIATCGLMKARGHYRVQRDEHSNPLPFEVRSAMDWRLPTADAGRERMVRFIASSTATTCIADFDRIDRPVPDPSCRQIVAAVRARGDTLARAVAVWLPDTPGAP